MSEPGQPGAEPVGPTRGYRRHARDFYQADGKPKELWVRALRFVPPSESSQPDGRALHVVAALDCASDRLMAERPVDERSNEMTAFRPMLEPLALDGKPVSADAIQTYDEDRCQVRDPNSAQILATLRSMARFLTRRGAHRPKTDHQRTTPALHRFCYAHVGETIGWLTSPRAPC